MNILYLGSSGTSGYALATKNAMLNYKLHGHNVKLIPIEVDNSRAIDNNLSNKIIDDCINSNYEYYDLMICEMAPSSFIRDKACEIYNKLCNNAQCKIVLKTVWETNRISSLWIPILNDPIWNAVWVPSEWNKAVFIESGVTTNIEVHKYVSYNFPCNPRNKSNIPIPFHHQFGIKDILTTYNFYYISTWNLRKNNVRTLHTFCETFTNSDNVSLLMKTGFNSYSDDNTRYVYHEITKILEKYKNPPTIVLFPNNYSDQDINRIHAIGDCYFLLHRGEGLGFSSYDAYLANKPVIVTGYGGQVEYFSHNYPYFVKHRLVDVSPDMPFDCYKHSHQWAEPDYEHAKQLMLEVYHKFGM